MFRDFAENDIVWSKNQKSEFLPGKIVVDESTGDWRKEDDDQVFVEVFPTGPGRRPKGKWLKASDVIFFDVAKNDETTFDKAGLNKAYNLAKKDFLENGKRASVKVKRCKPEDVTKTPTQKKLGRPPKSAGGKSSSKKVKMSKKMLKDIEQKSQMNKNVSDDEEDEDDIDEESRAKFAEDNKNFLDDISSDDDDEDKENDWRPGDKENIKPNKKRFVFKKMSKMDRKPFAPLVPMPKEEPSEYEKLQDRRKLEQRQMLESMKLASFALTKAITPNPPRRKTFGGSAKGPAHRRRSAPVMYSTRTQPPRTRSKVNMTETSFSEFRSPTKRTLFEEDCDNDDYVAAKRGRKVRAHPTRWIRDPNSDFLKADEVTEEMLENVSDYVSEKIYNQVLNLFFDICLLEITFKFNH